MPRNLDPQLIAFEAKLERGAILRLAEPAKGAPKGGSAEEKLAGNVLRFQYNPETITRTRAGTWEPRKKRKGLKAPSPQDVRLRSGQGSSSLLAESEQITLRVTFDATEAALAGRAGSTPEKGVLPELAFLELASTGKVGPEVKQGAETVQPIRPHELLLILGRERMFPVVLTNVTITEQKFLPSLVPLRAEVELKFNVLEPYEASYSRWISVAFDQLLRKRQEASQLAEAKGDVVSAIANELNRGGSP